MEKALEILKHYHNLCSQLFVQTGDEEYRDEYVKINEAIAELEAMKPKTCLDCKHYSQSTFYGDLKVVKYCHENRLGIGDINFQIFCCNKFEPKDNA